MKIRSLLPWLAALATTTAATLAMNGASAQQSYSATLVCAAPQTSVWGQQLATLKTQIEAQTNNQVQITLQFGGDETTLVQGVKAGTHQAGSFSTQAIAHAASVPRLQVVELPYLFRSTAEVDHVLDTVVLDPITADLAAQDLVFGMWSDNGWLNLTATSAVFNSPSELGGSPLRRQPGWLHEQLFSALGGPSTPLELSQIAPALGNDAIKGMEASVQYLAVSGLTPIKKVTETQHIFQPGAVVWSEGFWDTLPPDLKAKIRSIQQSLTPTSRAAIRAEEASARSTLQAQGTTFHTPTDLDGFKTQTQSIYGQYSSLSPESAELLQQVQSALNTMRGQ